MHPVPRLRLLLVWTAIAAMTAGAVALQSIRSEPAGAADLPEERLVEPVSLQSELMGKLCLALHEASPLTPVEQVMANAEPLRSGGLADRLGYAILLGRVGGWERALEEIDAIEIPETEAGSDATDLVARVRARIAEPAAGGDVDEEAEGAAPGTAEVAPGQAARPESALETRLGFFARILDGDADGEAMRTLAAMIAVGAWYAVVFLAGVAVLGTLLGYGVFGRLRPRLEPVGEGHAAVVLGETFALWMGSFLLLTVTAAIAGGLLADILGEAFLDYAGALSASAFLASLWVLAYPRLRGIGWSDLRRAIGLHAGAGVLREAGHGVLCYLGAIPFLAFGLAVYALLSILREFVAGGGAQPSHPAVEQLGSAGPAGIALLFLLAAVVAPIVEEIAFRGILYGHLRGVVSPRIRVASALVAALASSFIFAVVHPQGILFVPALGGLAVGFCLFRELRGSLIAPMVAHGINNAVTLTIGLWLMG
jgi:membrane protease YdiL (CAAX protease family)